MTNRWRHIARKLIRRQLSPPARGRIARASPDARYCCFPVHTIRPEQVTMPQSSLPRVGFIGAGRLARCLALAFARAGYPVTAAASRSADSARRLAAQIAHCAAFDDPQQVVDAADIVFLAVPDDSIGTTAHTLRFGGDATSYPGKALVHCSGASPVELLAPARDQGAAIGGLSSAVSI
ncbi:putative short-subunit dehydrogenase-like oxidoreductase (DUF2520 family) [Paraburkholderia atlantica]